MTLQKLYDGPSNRMFQIHGMEFAGVKYTYPNGKWWVDGSISFYGAGRGDDVAQEINVPCARFRLDLGQTWLRTSIGRRGCGTWTSLYNSFFSFFFSNNTDFDVVTAGITPIPATEAWFDGVHVQMGN